MWILGVSPYIPRVELWRNLGKDFLIFCLFVCLRWALGREWMGGIWGKEEGGTSLLGNFGGGFN